MEKPVVLEQSEAYFLAFDHLNGKLFDGELISPMLVLTRNQNVIRGYFAPDRWHNEDGNTIHEISLNANAMNDDVFMLMNVLIHEIVHLWQYDFGKISRPGYHNKQFAEKCKEIGLSFKGPETGQAVETHIVPGGRAYEAVASLPESAILPWMSGNFEEKEKADQKKENQGGGGNGRRQSRSGKRAKYTCPECGLNAWAKQRASLLCGECDRLLVEQKKEGG